MLSEERQKDLESAISQIERQFGQGSIMKMDGSTVGQFPAVSSGNLAMDIALGIGGLPRGRIIEIYGPEASGKTTLALCAIAEVQKIGGVAALLALYLIYVLLKYFKFFIMLCKRNPRAQNTNDTSHSNNT